MKRDDLLVWLLAAMLLAAIAATIIFAPKRSRHGYGRALPDRFGGVCSAA